MHGKGLRRAVRAVTAGGVIAYPTEAVYGLGCDPLHAEAVGRILEIKRRSWRRGLILVAADPSQLEPYVRYPTRRIRARVAASWPGPHTWVLPAGPLAPPWIRGARRTIAVRVSAHPPVCALTALTGPLVSTSANPEGRAPARSAARARAYFGAALDGIVVAPLGQLSRPTEIRHAVTDAVLRP